MARWLSHRITRKRFHLARVILWATNIPIAIMTGLSSSVAYLTFISLAALVESSATDYEAARLDQKNAQGEPIVRRRETPRCLRSSRTRCSIRRIATSAPSLRRTRS